MAARRPVRTQIAKTLAELPLTLQAEALETEEEIRAYYKEEIRKLRGVDRIEQMRISLEDAHAADFPFKAFLVGHPGVGKTTELTRLLLDLEDKFTGLRLSVLSELNPGSLRFYDILLLILIRIVETVTSPKIIGFTDPAVEELLARVRDHLSTKWTKRFRVDAKDFGGGLELPFFKLRANIKLGSTKEHGEEDYQLSFVSDLVALMNDVLTESNKLLSKHKSNRKFLVVLEDLEKLGLDAQTMKSLFVGLQPHLAGLDAHFIITIPVWLKYSDDQVFGLLPSFQCFVLPDLPVYAKNHDKDGEVIGALVSVVQARADESLFEPNVLEALCIASGGNLRDLFALIRDAMLAARLRSAVAISSADAEGAVASLRNEYKQLLGSTSESEDKVTLDGKLDRLKALYERSDPAVEVPDPVLYLLLRQRCALQYNGEGWIGVHPLVVDLLREFGRIENDARGGTAA